MTEENFNNICGSNTTTDIKYDLDLFISLNREYQSRKIVAKPRELSSEYRKDLARKRAIQIDKRANLKGKVVVEVGCGGGEFSWFLVNEYKCTVIGVDIVKYPTWKDLKAENLKLTVCDLGQREHWKEIVKMAGGRIDRMVSLVTWEHVKHPYTMLQNCYKMLKPNGLFYLRANLYRSAVASHLYREVYFPWPHLLFSDQVFEQFYLSICKKPKKPSWLNKLTYAQYLLYFDKVGFKLQNKWLSHRKIDADFYKRFDDKLSRYPQFDLSLDFFEVLLKKRRSSILG